MSALLPRCLKHALLAALALAVVAAPASARHQNENTTLYVRGDTFLLSRSLTGGVPNGPSRNAAISWDQRINKFAAYESDATDIVEGDTNGFTDVFLVRRAPGYGPDGTPWGIGSTDLASRGIGGQPANGRSYLPALDGDSNDLDPRCLAFVSEASNLVRGDTNGVADVFVKDLRSERITRVSVDGRGRQANGPSFDVSLSGDCTRVAFTSSATNLALTRARTPNHRNMVTKAPRARTKQVYVRVLPGSAKDKGLVGTTFLASATNKVPGNGHSVEPAWSRAGKVLAFTSSATNLSPNDRSPVSDVYTREAERKFRKFRVRVCKTKKVRGKRRRVCRRTVRGLQTFDLATRLVSVNGAGEPGNGPSSHPSMTDSGRHVAYQTEASNLVPGDANGFSDVIRADMKPDRPAQLLLSRFGDQQANGPSHRPVITGAGIATFFDSDASNLKIFPHFIDDQNGVRDMMVGIPIHGSAGVDSLNSDNHYVRGGISENPAPSTRHNYVLFESTAPDMDTAIPNPGQRAIYLRYDGPFDGTPVTE